MSQSPTDQESLSSLTRYRQGWKALNRLLHENRSFSGNEKNCAFLSMRDGEFAAISSVSGLDFHDDSRALALCDWDFDGKLDMWSSARTAPRIRFLHNQTHTTGHFIAVQLRGNGTTTNRDGIGARVEIVNDNTDEKSILTLHAGAGFLTQSSRWLHFGLGDTTSVKAIRISWPGGKEETYGDVEADRFYVVSQSSGKAVAWQPPTTARKPIIAQEQRIPASSQTARIVPPYRLPLPNISYVDASSGKQRFQIQSPTLVSVWSAACSNCIREFGEWSQQADEFRTHGLEVVVLNADIDAKPEEIELREQLLKDLGFAFKSLTPTASTVRRIDLFQRAIMDLWQPMPVPCTFLLDQFGRVVAIYKGPVELEQIWKDMSLFKASPDELRASGLPFAGRWGSDDPKADPKRISSQMIDHTQLSGAIDYLQQFLVTSSKAGDDVSHVRRSDIQYIISVLLESQDRTEEAIGALEACRELNPNDFRVRTDLAKQYLKRKDFPAAEKEFAAAVEINSSDTTSRRLLAMALLQQQKLAPAIQQLEVLLKQTPQDATTHFHLGNALRKSGEWARALRSYRSAVDYRPTFVLAANNLAWIMATHPDDKLRDGKSATELAERMCQQTKFNDPTLLDTLAAAYAENGEFDKAVKTIDRAMQLLKADADSKQDSSSLSERRDLYLKQKPYRDDG